MADHAQHEAGDDVDPQDQQRGDRIALHELAGAVHRAIEVGLGRHLAAAGLGLVGGQQAGGKIGVDRHLLARQGIEREARRDFRNASRALGDHHHVDDHQDHEDEQPDREVAADQEGAEGLDHMAGGRPALVPVDQHDAGRGDVERQAQQRGEQQDRGERAEIERLFGIHRRHQDRHRQRDVEHEEQVEQQRRGRHHHQADQRQDPGRQSQGGRLDAGENAVHSPNALSLP